MDRLLGEKEMNDDLSMLLFGILLGIILGAMVAVALVSDHACGQFGYEFYQMDKGCYNKVFVEENK